jgi:hypothetical protein
MYHPAAALYSGSLKPVLFEDIAKLPKVLTMIREGAVISAGEVVPPPPPDDRGPTQGSLLSS